MKKILFLLCLAWAMLPCAAAQQNIILLIADDLGTDYCGFSKDARDTARMPNIRSLLSRGVRFDNAWANPNCSPTRAGMLTGRYSFRTGVGTAISGPGYAQLDTAEVTLSKLLKKATPIPYATANIGKWHLNQQTQQSLAYPNYMGYDYYAGNFLGEITSYTNWKKVTDGTGPVTVTTYATTDAVNDAIAWLGGLSDGQPFFLWLGFNAPHTPFHKPPDALHTVPGLTGTQQHINQNPKLYFKAMIEAMDTETGRLLQWLSQTGRLDSTNIVFIGDNGNLKRVSQIADTSQGKGTLYEYGVRVPFVVSGPAVVVPGRATDALVSTHDLFATILEMTGLSHWPDLVPPSKPVDSQSFVPVLKNQSIGVRSWCFTEQFNPVPDPDDGKAIRNAAYKLLDFDDGHQEFYRLTDDPLEQTDLLLQLPLSADALSNYTALCNQLSALVGTPACQPTVSVASPAANAGGWGAYPNPTSGLAALSLPPGAEHLTEASVWDVYGRRVATFWKKNGVYQADLSAQPDGAYWVRLQQGGAVRCVLLTKI